MDLAAARLERGRRHARLVEAFCGNAWERGDKPLGRMTVNMTPGPGGRCFVSGLAGSKLRISERKELFTSSRTSICGRRDRPIRKKIIGHGMPVLRERFTDGRVFQRLLWALLPLHQPARQHGGGVFLHPKIEKGADLLAEIGGMAETREFITLERISRCREQKLLRGLGLVVVHWGLRESDGSKINSALSNVNITTVPVTVEKCGKAWHPAGRTADHRTEQSEVYSKNKARGTNVMRACSACAGDYEDPDRTAWIPGDAEDEERDDAPGTSTEGFPAEE